MYGKEPRNNEPRFNEILVITNTIQKRKRKMYLDITNKCQQVTESYRLLTMLFGKEHKVFYLREGPLENLWGGGGGGARAKYKKNIRAREN